MKKIFLDFESFYDKIYSLRNMSPIEYILDRRWEMLGCGVAVDDNPPRFYPQEKVIEFLESIGEPYIAISHNALFDMCILAWRHAIHPPAMIDTMSLCRAVLMHETRQSSVALSTILKHLGLEDKLDTIKDMEGVHYDALIRDSELLVRFVTYTLRDVRGCREIFNHLIPGFPTQELRIAHNLICMATKPQLLLDQLNLKIYYEDIVAAKRTLLMQLGYERAKYMSSQQFADLLRQHGVEPPMKMSPTTGKLTYAFARTDEDFMALQEHPNITIQALVGARLGVRSTIEETRTARFISIAKLTASSYGHSWLPVPLKYSGAHTHRFSGDWKLNMQNLANRKTKALRSSIRAPHGMVILVVDASQIEARITAYLAGQKNLLAQFANPLNDVYAWFGSIIYQMTITKKTHPIERFNSKTIVLGLGFGMSARKLLITLRNAASENNIQAVYSIEQCEVWVTQYRTIMDQIPLLWRRCDWILQRMLNPAIFQQPPIGPVYADGNTLVLPSGLRIYYDDIEYDGNNITYKYGSGRRKIYGAKVTENIVQALDRQHVEEANIRTEDRCAKEGLDIRRALQEHDANAYVVPVDCVQLVTKIALEEMCRPPAWAPGIPLAAEARCGQTYGVIE